MTAIPQPEGHPTTIEPPSNTIDLSVVLCTLDGERWLPALLDSIAAQTLPPDELIVHDDASTDGTVALLRTFAEHAPFPVHIHENTDRLGSTRNFAAALARSRGQVVALADQDDLWHPVKLELLTWEFDQDPTISMVFSDADLLAEDGTRLGRRLWSTRMVGRTLRRHAVVPEELFARRALTTGCTMAIRRRVVEAALPFPSVLDDAHAPMRHDRWLSLVAAAVGTVRAVPEPLVGFRVHPAQETGVLVGGKLARALGRAALRVPTGADHSVEHTTRAAQLRAAAGRAEAVGDFNEANTLRSVAEHQHDRSLVGHPGHHPRLVAQAAIDGSYRGDPLSALAITADLIRSVRSRPFRPRRREESRPPASKVTGA